MITRLAIIALLLHPVAKGANLDSLLTSMLAEVAPRTAEAAPRQDTATTPTRQKETTATPITVTRPEIIEKLQSRLREHFHQGDTYTIKTTANWNNIRIPSENWDVIISDISESAPSRNLFVTFELNHGASQIMKLRWPLRASLLQQSHVASRHIPAGQELQRTDVATHAINVLASTATPLPAHTDISLYKTTKSLRPGQPLDWKYIAEKPTVKKGDTINVVASEGSLHVNLSAVALQDGLRGDFITVRNPSSNKTINVLLIDNHHAEISF